MVYHLRQSRSLLMPFSCIVLLQKQFSRCQYGNVALKFKVEGAARIKMIQQLLRVSSSRLELCVGHSLFDLTTPILASDAIGQEDSRTSISASWGQTQLSPSETLLRLCPAVEWSSHGGFSVLSARKVSAEPHLTLLFLLVCVCVFLLINLYFHRLYFFKAGLDSQQN